MRHNISLGRYVSPTSSNMLTVLDFPRRCFCPEVKWTRKWEGFLGLHPHSVILGQPNCVTKIPQVRLQTVSSQGLTSLCQRGVSWYLEKHLLITTKPRVKHLTRGHYRHC